MGGVYKGVTATIMKQGSNQAIRFFVMESLRDWYKGGDRDKPVPKYMVGLFGGVAGKYTDVSQNKRSARNMCKNS